MMNKRNSQDKALLPSDTAPANTAPVHVSGRPELRSFLRARRQGIRPEAVGLPKKSQRRARGLTRDEVAELAGVSTGWYAQFELGRPINISPKTLDAIATALRLDYYETQYLFTLAGTPLPEDSSTRPGSIPLDMRAIVDAITSFPAQILSRRFDVLYMNRVGEAIFNRSTSESGDQYNLVWRLFMDPERRRMHERWEDFARAVTAALRHSYASAVGDPWFEELIARLRSGSADFTRFWNEYRVAPAIGQRSTITLEPFGVANIVWSVLPVPDSAGLFLAFVTPADEESAARLCRYAEEI
jgi:transcriptional regulator with XRE-family HTH domain